MHPSHDGNRVAVVLLMLIAVALAGCGLQQDLGASATNAGVVAPSPAPALRGPTLTGSSVDIAAWRGRPVVIDFWASWCGPCRAEQPELNRLDTQFAAEGVHFLGVDLRDNNAAALAYVAELHVPYPSIPDPSEQITAIWGVDAPPTIFVVDANGQVRGKFLGTLSGLSTLVGDLLAGKGG